MDNDNTGIERLPSEAAFWDRVEKERGMMVAFAEQGGGVAPPMDAYVMGTTNIAEMYSGAEFAAILEQAHAPTGD